MASGPEHYREAERMRDRADEWEDADWGWKAHISTEERIARRMADLSEAQVHATLANAAAQAWQLVDKYKGDSHLTNAWSDAIGWIVDAEIVGADEGQAAEEPAAGEPDEQPC